MGVFSWFKKKKEVFSEDKSGSPKTKREGREKINTIHEKPKRIQPNIEQLIETSDIEGLKTALKDKDASIRIKIVEAFEKIGDTHAVESLIDCLNDKDPGVRGRTAVALGHIKTDRSVEALINALQDEYVGVRRKVVNALGNIGSIDDFRITDALSRALKDKDYRVREFAVKILIKKVWKPSNLFQQISLLIAQNLWEELIEIGSPAVDPLIEFLEKVLDDNRWWSETAACIADTLGKIKDGRAVVPLISGLKVENRRIEDLEYASEIDQNVPTGRTHDINNWEVRERVTIALGNLGDIKAIDALKKSAENDPSDSVRKAAKEAYEKIQRSASK